MTASALLVAALYGVPAIVWAIITQQMWGYVRIRRPESLAFRLMPLVGGAFVLHYVLLVGLVLAPPGLPMDPWELARSHRNLASEVTWLLIVCLLRHLVHLLPIPERRPSVAWLTVNYGLAALAASADPRAARTPPPIASTVTATVNRVITTLSMRSANGAASARPTTAS